MYSDDYRNSYHPRYRIVERNIFETEIKPYLPEAYENDFINGCNNDCGDNGFVLRRRDKTDGDGRYGG